MSYIRLFYVTFVSVVTSPVSITLYTLVYVCVCVCVCVLGDLGLPSASVWAVHQQ